MTRPHTPQPRQSHRPPRLSPLSPVEEAQLLAALPDLARPVVTLALRTGLRLSELRVQAWHDIDLTTGRLRVTCPKEGRPRVLPLTRAAVAVLTTLRQDGPLLFPTLPRTLATLVRTTAQQVGLGPVTRTCLRATALARGGAGCAPPHQ
jgi:integrase